MKLSFTRIVTVLVVFICGVGTASAADTVYVQVPVQVTSAAPVKPAKLKPKFLYNVDFLFFFDNREYDKCPYQRSQTLFGARLSPEIGVGIADSTIGDHRLMAGCSYVQPIGADYKNAKVLPTIYYQYGYKGFKAHLGLLPFTKMIEDFPDYLQYDSIAYFHPNIQGALFNYRDRRGFVELMCDWRGMWSETTREAFRVTINGRYEHKWFFVGGRAMMNHLACYSPEYKGGPQPGVCDDLLGSAYVGFNIGKVTPLDSFVVRASYLISMQNDRDADIHKMPQGGLLEIFLRWRWIGFRNVTYYGEPQMPLYPKYHSLLNQGDPFYQARFYNRTDIFFYIFNNSFVNCFASANFHLADGYFVTQQQIVAQFSLDGVWGFRNNKHKLRTILGK